MAALLTGDLLQLGVARAVGGVLLPIGLALLALALGVALTIRSRSRKLRGGVGVLGVILTVWGGWSLLTKPDVKIIGLKAYPLQQVLPSGQPCPASIEVLAVVRAKGGPGPVGLQLSFFGAGKTVAVAPMFQQSEMESGQSFGPFKVALPANPPRTGAPLVLHSTTPTEASSTSLIRNAGCQPRR